MVVGGLHLGLGQSLGRFAGQTEAIRDHNGAVHVAALDQHGPGPHVEQLFARREGVLHVGDAEAGQHFGVGREQIAAGQDFFFQSRHRVLLQQAAAALAYGHGVHHQGKGAAAQNGADGADDARGKQHAGFGRGHGKACQHGFEFQSHEFGLRRLDARDAQAVLGRQGGDDAHAVAAQGHDGFQVGLDARAAAGVGTGNGQNVRGGRHTHSRFGLQM